MAAEQQVQGPAHLVLSKREDPTAGRSSFPARLLVRGAHGDAVAAHPAGMDIFLNGGPLCDATHSIPPTRSGAELRELAVGLDGSARVLGPEVLAGRPGRTRDVHGRLPGP